MFVTVTKVLLFTNFVRFYMYRLLFRERQSQASAAEKVGQPSQQEEAPADVKMESNDDATEEQTRQEGGSEEVKLKIVPSEDTPMETGEDKQPKSKPEAVTQTSKSSQTGSLIPNQSGQTGLVASTSTGADIPYFPAHPISYFPDDVVESSASAAAQPPPPQRTGPVSIFDQQFSLFAIEEDGPPLQVPALEPFKVSQEPNVSAI